MAVQKLMTLAVMAVLSPWVLASVTTEFCLDGEFDLGVRYQGLQPNAGERYPTTWCVISEDDSSRIVYFASGQSNPDMKDDWRVAYLPPDLVRIVNRESPPDIEFAGTDNADEARRVRRIDPRRFTEEFLADPGSVEVDSVKFAGKYLTTVTASADMPLRGRVPVAWHWDWKTSDRPTLRLMLDNELLFHATGRWRTLGDDEKATLWQSTKGVAPTKVPGDRWPARINMKLITLSDGVYLVRGVRTGFQHMVVDTDTGLVVADAPTGWTEFHHLPPADVVPGLGINGLSYALIDFLHEQFPRRPLHAVVLTHFHDDHSGGARAFASEGAAVYASGESASFFNAAFNRLEMPVDRNANVRAEVEVIAVSDKVTIGSSPNRVELMPIGANPHAGAMLGVHAVDKKYFFVSDIHVPRSDDDKPREGREMTECWFANWAVKHLPADTIVVNSHSPDVTPVSRLARYLASDACKAKDKR